MVGGGGYTEQKSESQERANHVKNWSKGAFLSWEIGQKS